ncbi:MAG: sugar phosphate isomerase/epimerase [Lentisphaeria bacterium]|nr:sugar phosphate isomerase/epimerase [Lentisphaeria bacterium]
MFQAPVTYLFDFEHTDDKMRPYIMHEFAANGAKHLVLSDTLLRMIMNQRNMAVTFSQEMAAEGLSFCDAHAVFGPYLDLNCPVAEARPEMLLRHKLQLEIIASIGVKTVTIHVGNENQYPEYSLETQVDCVKRSLDELLPFAEKRGIIICIENIWTRINTADRLLEIKKEYLTDTLGFCYDAGHANLMDKGRNFPESNPYSAWGTEPPQFDDRILEKMLPHVVNCHLHDNNGIADQHFNIGRGTVDWKHIVRLLKQAPRLQAVQSEVIPVRTRDSIREICEKFRWLNEL